MKCLAVHLVPFLLLSLCTLTIGAFIQLLRRFGLTISLEETVLRAVSILKQCYRREQNLLQMISRRICLLWKQIHYPLICLFQKRHLLHLVTYDVILGVTKTLVMLVPTREL